PLNYLKNALTRVRMDAEAFLSGRLGKEELPRAEKRMREMFDLAESGIRRIAATVELMTSYSKAGFSRQLRPHDVYAAVREVVAMVLPATGRPVQVDLDLEGDGTVECVPEEFNQVIANLVQNAVEACPETGGLVRVRGTREEENLLLAVKDNGPGIRPEDAQRIFTKFFTTKGPVRGLGMGLTIVWRVVQILVEMVDAMHASTPALVERVPTPLRRSAACATTPRRPQRHRPVGHHAPPSQSVRAPQSAAAPRRTPCAGLRYPPRASSARRHRSPVSAS